MNDFLCPKCQDHLCVGEHLILKVKNSRKQSALLLLHPQIGNYSSIKHPSFEFKKGEILEFFCPLCNATLKSDIHQNLAMVVMFDETGKRSAVYFSQIAGEQSTYETHDDLVHAAGQDAGKYTYFKLGDKFKKYI
jgi:hypothetical protein